ncbi:MAG TPA: hypothetical protein VGL62_04760 [Vicinamibacterales bacterium]
MRRIALTALLLFSAAGLSCAPHAQPAAPGAPPPAAAVRTAPAPTPPHLPDRLSDRDYWDLIGQVSEPNGSFRSDNLLSNELYLQYIIPDLLSATKPQRVYMGVGPEQNFTYIAAIKPAMAFIVDVRRGNLDLQLMYKALFEMSADRADFVSRLFSRKRPAGLTPTSSISDIFDAFAKVPADDALFDQTLQAIIDRLQQTHGFALEADDVPGIRYVFEYFKQYGPDLTYWVTGGFGGRGGFRNAPTYADLMVSTDADGTMRSYLASDENFNVLKSMESKNLIVPVVGNFAGPKALRAVGTWMKAHNGMVAAFYLSNVEQYLNMDGVWMDFCANAATLPIDDSSQFIRAFRGPGYGGWSLAQGISPMLTDLKMCTAAGAAAAR